LTFLARRRVRLLILPGLALAALAGCDSVGSAKDAQPPPAAPGGVAARGRLKPKNGVIRVAGPSDFVTVVARLMIEEGDHVEPGQTIAEMDTLQARTARVVRIQAQITAQQASIVRLEAEARNARAQFDRFLGLSKQGIVSASEGDYWTTQVDVADARVQQARAELASGRADLRSAQAERDMSVVRAPIRGQVLKIHARPGEKIGPDGIAELATTDAMYAVAEVYETDITRVKVGQRARVRSPALARDLEGTVERVGLKVGKLDALGTDPAAKTDARVVEVEIRLDDSAAVSGLTNLEVEVLISA
jgi:HlyD family secretion protein